MAQTSTTYSIAIAQHQHQQHRQQQQQQQQGHETDDPFRVPKFFFAGGRQQQLAQLWDSPSLAALNLGQHVQSAHLVYYQIALLLPFSVAFLARW